MSEEPVTQHKTMYDRYNADVLFRGACNVIARYERCDKPGNMPCARCCQCAAEVLALIAPQEPTP